MKTVELFCGTKSFSKYAAKLGHETFTVDIEVSFEPDLVLDLSREIPEALFRKVTEADIVWMSPPCTTFSMAAGNKHWTADREARTAEALNALNLLMRCLGFARISDGIYFIENPRARARWFMPEYSRHTVWYCQYGDDRAKPTDIWTNLKGWQPRTCKNNAIGCHHDRAPRGSKTGTQGRKDSTARGEIPEGLFKEIFELIEVGRT